MVPGTDVLADIAAVDLISKRIGDLVGDLAATLRPVRQALFGVENVLLVERTRWTGIDTERARATAFPGRLGCLRHERRICDQRANRDKRAEAGRNRHRVLAGKRQSSPASTFAVDVMVGVDVDDAAIPLSLERIPHSTKRLA